MGVSWNKSQSVSSDFICKIVLFQEYENLIINCAYHLHVYGLLQAKFALLVATEDEK